MDRKAIFKRAAISEAERDRMEAIMFDRGWVETKKKHTNFKVICPKNPKSEYLFLYQMAFKFKHENHHLRLDLKGSKAQIQMRDQTIEELRDEISEGEFKLKEQKGKAKKLRAEIKELKAKKKGKR